MLIGYLQVLTRPETPNIASFAMNKLRESAFLNKLESLHLDEIARHIGIENCYTKKVHAKDLLVSFLLLINQGAISLKAWARQLSLLIDQPLSKQAMALKFEQRYQAFFEAVVAALLQQHLQEPVNPPDDLFAPFARVLVEDSTCLSVPEHLHSYFPSSYCATGAKATLRLQWLHDLKAERLVRFAIQSYRDNDQKHASAVVALAQIGDLILRDLGYYSTPVFEALDQRGAFFLSRLHYRVQVLDAQTEAVIDLVKLIETESVQASGWLDCTVLLGAKQRLGVRLVGMRLPDAVVVERRRRAREQAKRDPRRGYSARYAKWLAWSFYVTNIPSSVWSIEQVARAYRLRWRIEMLFKALKHIGQVRSLFSEPRQSYCRVMMTMLGVLLYALLVMWPYYRYFSCRIGRLSLLSFLAWLRVHLLWVLLSSSVGEYEVHVACHCVYERRRKRKNYLELRYDT